MTKERAFYKLAPATQTELRRRAVAMVAAGKTRIEAAEAVGVNRRFVGQWVAAVKRSGEAALAGKRRGRRPGEQKALTLKQEARLRRLIAEKCPDQLKLPALLWTRDAAGALIARETGVQLSPSGVGRYLRAWGFTVARPVRRGAGRRAGDGRTRLPADYPAIARRAKLESGEVQWLDMFALPAPADEPGARQAATPRSGQLMISSLTNQGKLRFMVHIGTPSGAVFLEFLRRLADEAGRKLFLMVPDVPAHRARPVAAWLRQNSSRVELFYR